MIEPTNRKNWLTFGGDPVSDTDSGSLFHFPHHCGIGHFRRFINISHTVTSRFSRHSAKWLMPTRQWIHSILGTIRQTSGSQSRLIRIFRIRIPDHVLLRLDALANVCALWAQSTCSYSKRSNITLGRRLVCRKKVDECELFANGSKIAQYATYAAPYVHVTIF